MFSIFYFWSWIFKTTSKFWSAPCKKASNPPACSVHGLHRILSSYWLAHWKIRQSAALFWFRLQNDGIFYLRAAIQRTIDASPAFMEYGLAKKFAAWAHANRKPNKQEVGFNFAWSGSELWSCFKYSMRKLKNQKHTAVDVLLKGFPMVPLSWRSNLAGRYLWQEICQN